MSETPPNSSVDPSLGQGNLGVNTEIDRTRLNEIIKTTLQPGILFGRGIELTDHDRQQIERVADMVDAKLEPYLEDPDWKKFMTLVEEGNAKGVLISFTMQKGTNVPMWCVNGGDDPEVKKVMRPTDRSEVAGIQVPQKIFDLYHWQNTLKRLNRYVTTSNEGLRGTSARYLGEDLRHLAHFVKQMPQDPGSS